VMAMAMAMAIAIEKYRRWRSVGGGGGRTGDLNEMLFVFVSVVGCWAVCCRCLLLGTAKAKPEALVSLQLEGQLFEVTEVQVPVTRR
jgi:hypothetical protein